MRESGCATQISVRTRLPSTGGEEARMRLNKPQVVVATGLLALLAAMVVIWIPTRT